MQKIASSPILIINIAKDKKIFHKGIVPEERGGNVLCRTKECKRKAGRNHLKL